MIIIFQRILPHYRTGFFIKFAAKFKKSKILYGQPFKDESLKNDDLKNDDTFQKVKNLYFNKKGSIFIKKPPTFSPNLNSVRSPNKREGCKTETLSKSQSLRKS